LAEATKHAHSERGGTRRRGPYPPSATADPAAPDKKGRSMFSDTDARSGWLRRGPAVLGAVSAAGLLAAVPAFAQAPIDATFVHSAKRGELGDGRLTLQGGGPRVTWAHRSRRSGVMAVRRMHRLVFSGVKRRRPARCTWRAIAGVRS
jgi:hypothetical protein